MNDDEQQLREQLEAITAPPSRLEAEALLEAGRRRSFRRRTWQAAGGVALATTGVVVAVPLVMRDAAPPPPTAAVVAGTPSARTVACTSKALRLPPGAKEATADGVDPSGRYIIGHDSAGQDFRPILWTDGVPKRLPQKEKSVQLTTVNARGVVAGLATEGNSDYVFRYDNGRFTRLKPPSGRWHVYPWPMMNAAGDIVINAEPEGNIEGKDSIALYWKAGTTTAVKLPLPTEANVYDITDDGTIVGGTFVDGEGREAYAWDLTGKGRKLTAPDDSRAIAYAAEGNWATGGLWRGNSDGKAVLWDLRTGELTKLDGPGPGDAVNKDGWVVSTGTAFRNGEPLELPVPKGRDVFPRGVSNTGLIVGHTSAQDDNGLSEPRTWQC
ncbi:hypothetical protein Aab01nite_72580 [Paractinoplanes abujensis]|uniref:Putative membrane protein n=1 Tax=Paractinoplanes abujensis TaxID=882441 RepID=A0A7W7CX75_9ACTN|nr:hypothetical protein [Actinoplanes abujensis]MBB4694938.1 putative membrane protein [Actinoplanes abujensis]GID23668.1 hypothetical protein Aab01nite_72580 [Actinoplanes abujensis]